MSTDRGNEWKHVDFSHLIVDVKIHKMPNNDEDAQATIMKLQKQLEEAHAKAHNVEPEAKTGNNPHVSDYDTYQPSLTGRYCSAEIS